MGTRADFYVEDNDELEWVGSIAWDGHPESIPNSVLGVTSGKEFRNELLGFLTDRDDATIPSMGWPWPWDDSATTDYSYVFRNGKVWASNFGEPLFDPLLPEMDEVKLEWPDMSSRKNVTFGDRSGVILVGG